MMQTLQEFHLSIKPVPLLLYLSIKNRLRSFPHFCRFLINKAAFNVQTLTEAFTQNIIIHEAKSIQALGLKPWLLQLPFLVPGGGFASREVDDSRSAEPVQATARLTDVSLSSRSDHGLAAW